MKHLSIVLATAVAFSFASCGENKTDEGQEKPSTQETDTTAQAEIVPPEGFELVDMEPMTYLAIVDSVTQEELTNGTLSQKFGQHFGRIMEYLAGAGIDAPAGAPLSHWIKWDTAGYSTFEAGIPVPADGEYNELGDIKLLTVPARQAFRYRHFGAYDQVMEPYMTMEEYMKGDVPVMQNDGPWEMYITDPGMEPDTSKWETQIIFPVERK